MVRPGMMGSAAYQPAAHQPAHRPTERPSMQRSRDAAPDQAGKRILIVEDETVLRDLLSFALQESGYEVRGASNGAEALAVCREEPFDLVLLDVMMPVMDGREFLRSRFDGGCSAPVVVMSAVRALDVLKEPGVVAFVPKPFDLAEMERILGSFLD